MPNAIVKNVLISLVLVVLCVVIGAEAAENRKSAMGIIVALVGVSFMLWVGKRSWVLLFLLPPVLGLVPMPGILAKIPLPFLIGCGVLGYWFLMWGMGYVKFRWRSLWPLDLAVLAMFSYMVYSYIQHPVSMAIFGFDSEYVGGKEYFFCLIATLYYVAVSVIPCTYEQLSKVLSWAVKLSIIAAVLLVGLKLSGIYGGGFDMEALAESATSSRFSMFVVLGMYGIYLVYGQNTMLKVLMSPKNFLLIIVSLIGILLSGWREKMLNAGCVTLALAYIKRELSFCFVILFGVYGLFLYLSTEGVVKEMPYGIQRCVSVLPGVEIQENIRQSAQHSSEWRIEMWKWALDPRTRYINDYVWGDGFGISVDYLRRETIAQMRGTALDFREQFAVTGVWHSGVITTIHRLGFVGLGLFTLIFIIGFSYMIVACRALRGSALYLPALFFALPIAGAIGMFYMSAGTIESFFNTYIMLAMIKLFCCVAREQGLYIPLLQRQRYVPLAIQQYEENLRPAER